MAKSFRCSIVTPVASVFEGQVSYASMPAWDGQQGVMAGQSPLLTRLGIGSLRLDFPPPDGGSRWFLIEGGFAQVQDGAITLLTERATSAETLSLQQAQAELDEVRGRVGKPGEDQATVQRDQQRALAKKSLAQSMAQRGGAI